MKQTNDMKALIRAAKASSSGKLDDETAAIVVTSVLRKFSEQDPRMVEVVNDILGEASQ